MERRDCVGASDEQQDNEDPCPDRTFIFSVSLCFKLCEDLISYRLVTASEQMAGAQTLLAPRLWPGTLKTLDSKHAFKQEHPSVKMLLQ